MYDYQTERPKIFTDQGQRKFLKVRDQTRKLLRVAGAVRMNRAIEGVGGDSWELMAYVDRMVELGDIQEIPQERVAGQHRVFLARDMEAG